MIKDYMNLPEEIEGIGSVYPVSIVEWEEFSKLAQRFLLYSYDMIKYKFKIEQEIPMLDFLFATILQSETEEGRIKGIEELQQLFSIVLKEKVKAYYDTQSNEWILVVGENKGEINRLNFDSLKSVFLRQNLLFEPLIANNDVAQQIIDDAIKRMSRQGEEVDLESMIASISVIKGISPQDFQNYSYYQLRADYEISQRIENNRIIHLYRSQGGKAEPIGLITPLSIHENPYSFDKLFSKVDMNKEMNLQKMLS